MAPLPLLLLAAWASAASPDAGPKIAEGACSEADAKKLTDAWPEARKRVKAARDFTNKAISGEDPTQRKKAADYAKGILGVPAGDMGDVARILGMMDDILGRASFVCGGKADKNCKARNGYVKRGEGEVIHLCPGLFKDPKPEQLVRTMTHESAHLVDPQISQPEGEGYCLAFDCEMSCPGNTAYLVADNWAQYTHCASGQKPDEGFVIEAGKK